MTKQYFKDKLHGTNIDIENLPTVTLEGSRGKWIAVDSRTYQDNKGITHVSPIGVTRHEVYIVCPFCGGIHIHGNSKNGYEGFRISHCKIGNEYCLDK